MAIHSIEPITAEEEGFRLEPLPELGEQAKIIRRDPVQRLDKGDYVALVFRITGVGQDCDGSVLYEGEHVDAEGMATGFAFDSMGLQYGDEVKLDNPDDLIELAKEGA